MAKKVERAHRAANGGRPCGCGECVATRKKRGKPETVYVLDSASLAAQRYAALNGTEVYTADGRCMVASCDGGHLDPAQAREMAERIARLLTADEFEQANVRLARATGKTLTKITGVAPAGDDWFDAAWRASGRVYGDDALDNVKLGWKMRGEHLSARELRPSEDYVLAVEELKRRIEAVRRELNDTSEPFDDVPKLAQDLSDALAAFSKVCQNTKG